MNGLPAYVYVQHVCGWCPQRSEYCIGSLEIAIVKDGSEPKCVLGTELKS